MFVPGTAVPPSSAYTRDPSATPADNIEKINAAFITNYQTLNPPSLKEFILKNPVIGSNVPSGGTKECAYSKLDQLPLPLPEQIKFGNYDLSNREGIHPGPCEAWCDDEIVVPLTMDRRTILNKPIPYDKSKCIGKKRLTFYWLATYITPFQVHIGCAPIASSATRRAATNSTNGDRFGHL